ncbi:MAG: 1,4-alpha-glucan branching enzyme, partial [Methylococcaceae bacterium]|nr:1,4-alpha-glucan branching enzyme [Methylococcaceae bacterium]
MKKQLKNSLSSDFIKISEAKHHDPFSVLGRHQNQITVYLPYAEIVSFTHNGMLLNRVPDSDFFQYTVIDGEIPDHYQLSWQDKDGNPHENYDPYTFR